MDKCRNYYTENARAPYPSHIGKCLWSPEGSRWNIMTKLEPGDCIIHYITSRADNRKLRKLFIGFSRVKQKYTELSKDGVVEKLKKMGIWSNDYENFASKWLNEYSTFYFVELENFTEFRKKVSLDEIHDYKPRQFYIKELDSEIAEKIIKMGYGDFEESEPQSYTDQLISEKLVLENGLEDFINSLLDAGFNVLLVGPPGTGKTALAKMIAKKRGFKPYYSVATAHWSRYDLIGGVTLESGSAKWRSGYLLRALVKYIENKENYEKSNKSKEKLARNSTRHKASMESENGEKYKGAYLIIDEVNRADIDKAFGEFFLIFSSHNPYERIIPMELVNEIDEYVKKGLADDVARKFIEFTIGSKKMLKKSEDGTGYKVPEDFRIIATMNFIDARNLFTVGEAFTRRFAIVEVNPPTDIDKLLNKIYENLKEELKESNLPSNVKIDDALEDVKKLIDGKLRALYTDCKKSGEENAEGEGKSVIREVQVTISPASLYLAAKAFTVYYVKLNEEDRKKFGEDKKRVDDVLRKCLEAALPLSRLWDKNTRDHVEDLMKCVFKL